jgi:ribosome-binding factor A
MVSRRQEKMARLIKEVVSEGITDLNDPRIQGFISVTRVELSPDLRNCDVFLSVFGVDEILQNRTFSAVTHARSRLQSIVAENLRTRYCPTLRILKDEKFKKTLETMNLIDKAVADIDNKDEPEDDSDESKDL